MVDGEIISADSVQIYQGLDIGSAKPTAEEQAAVRHHLVDDLPFTAQYNAVEFAMAARAAIEDVVSRGKVPLVVGGTAFYLKSLVDGIPTHGVGNADPATAAKVEGMVSHLGWEDALAVLASHDPDYASTLYANDWRRLVRCLEVRYAPYHTAPHRTISHRAALHHTHTMLYLRAMMPSTIRARTLVNRRVCVC